MENTSMRKVRTWPGEDEDEHGGYVTACRLACAKVVAERVGLLLMPDVEDHAEDEDEQGACDACGYPDPSAMSDETKRSLTKAEQAYILEGGGDPFPEPDPDGVDHSRCPDCKGKGVVPLLNPDGTDSGDVDACDWEP
jgi:hypothetical protein